MRFEDNRCLHSDVGHLVNLLGDRLP